MKKNMKKNNIGMVGAIIGASIAVSLLSKDDQLWSDLKDHARDTWKKIKEKGDAFLEENIQDSTFFDKK